VDKQSNFKLWRYAPLLRCERGWEGEWQGRGRVRANVLAASAPASALMVSPV